MATYTGKVLAKTNDHPTARNEVDFEAACALMDDALAEQIGDKLDLRCEDRDEAQVYIDEYAIAHERVFGKPFIVN